MGQMGVPAGSSYRGRTDQVKITGEAKTSWTGRIEWNHIASAIPEKT